MYLIRKKGNKLRTIIRQIMKVMLSISFFFSEMRYGEWVLWFELECGNISSRFSINTHYKINMMLSAGIKILCSFGFEQFLESEVDFYWFLSNTWQDRRQISTFNSSEKKISSKDLIFCTQYEFNFHNRLLMNVYWLANISIGSYKRSCGDIRRKRTIHHTLL